MATCGHMSTYGHMVASVHKACSKFQFLSCFFIRQGLAMLDPVTMVVSAWVDIHNCARVQKVSKARDANMVNLILNR